MLTLGFNPVGPSSRLSEPLGQFFVGRRSKRFRTLLIEGE